MKRIRRFGKPVDELAKGKATDKTLRDGPGSPHCQQVPCAVQQFLRGHL